jgi:DNA-binding winged helix-turn-helix (wHTH) protein
MGTSLKHLYEFGSFQLDPPERLLLSDGHPVPMTPKAFDLLVVLVERSGHLLEKDELLKAVWPGSFVEEGNLSVTVSALRKALNDDRGLHKYIETVSKRGYRFVADVREIGEPERASNLPREIELPGVGLESRLQPAPVATPSPLNISRKRFAWKILAATLTVAALLILVRVIPRRAGGTNQAAAEETIHSLAILPFQTLGARRSDQYLGLGMADALITRLGNTGKIIVRPTSAIQKYAENNLTPQAAGQEQGVDAVRWSNSTGGRSRSPHGSTDSGPRRRAALGRNLRQGIYQHLCPGGLSV